MKNPILILLTLLLFNSVIVFAQSEEDKPKPALKKYELGINFGPAWYLIEQGVGHTTYSNLSVTGNFNVNIKQHLQVGMSVASGVSGDKVTAVAFTMSFPWGNEDFNLYPGWQFQYFKVKNGEDNIGPGVHVGGCVKINPSFALNAEGGFYSIFTGNTYYLNGGVKFMLD